MLATVLLLAGLAAGPAHVEPPDAMAEDPRLQRADSLFRAGAPDRALELALEVAEGRENQGRAAYEPLWRAASFALGAGVVEEAEEGSTERYRQALALAREARALDPEGIDARYWEVAALGRLALEAGTRQAAEYGEAIQQGATWILDREPDHDGAHHALGKLYMEVMQVSGISRFVGRTLTGNAALREASWERAELHLERAGELAPEMALYRLDLARLHAHRGRTDLARALVEELRSDPVRQPPDRVFRDEARELLRSLT